MRTGKTIIGRSLLPPFVPQITRITRINVKPHRRMTSSSFSLLPLPAAGSPRTGGLSAQYTPSRKIIPQSHGRTTNSPGSGLTQVKREEIKRSRKSQPCVTSIPHSVPSTSEVQRGTQSLTSRSDESICQHPPLSSSPHTSTL